MSRPPRLRSWHVASALGLASILWFWPLAAGLGTLTPAELDPSQTNWHDLWLGWLFRTASLESLVRQDLTLVNAPVGTDLRYTQAWVTGGLTAAMSWLLEGLGLQPTRALVAAYGLVLHLAWTFSAFATWLLARQVSRSSTGALFAAIAVASSPFLRGCFSTATSEVAWVGFIALAAGAVLAATPERWVRAGALALGWSVLASFSTRYLAIAVAGTMALLAAVSLVRGQRDRARAAGLALVGLVPLLLWLGWPQLTAGPIEELAGLPMGPNEVKPVYPSPLDFFRPVELYQPSPPEGWETHVYSVYVSWVLLALALFGAWRREGDSRAVLAFGVVFFALALGWRTPGGVPLPLTLLATAVPVLGALHAPSRWILVATLFLAVAAASAWAPGGRARVPGKAAAVGLIALLLAENIWATRSLWPFPAAPFPQASAGLAEHFDADDGLVLNFTLSDETTDRYELDNLSEAWQVNHGRPLMSHPAWAGAWDGNVGFELLRAGLRRDLAQQLARQVDPIRLSLPSETPLTRAVELGLTTLIVEDPHHRRRFACQLDEALGRFDCERLRSGP